MKLIFTLFLLFISSFSYSQEEIENWSHPFQVLFVDSAVYLGEEKQINQFDFIEKYDLIKNYGELVLVHYTGEIVKLNESDLNIREISKKYKTNDYVERPIISDPDLFKNNSINYRKRLTGTGSATCRPPKIDLIYPILSFDNELSTSKTQSEILFIWDSDSVERHYEIKIKNIFDELLYDTVIDQSAIMIPYIKLSNKEDLIIFEVSSPSIPNEIGQHAIVFREQKDESEYTLLLESLSIYWRGKPSASIHLFSLAIERSKHDYRFIKLRNKLFR